MRRKIAAFFVLTHSLLLFGNGGNPFCVSGDIFGTHAFIENRGQFNSRVISDESVLYAMEHGNERIYFLRTGLIYELRKAPELLREREDENEEIMERERRKKYKGVEIEFVSMNWSGCATQNIRVEASEKQSHYITYGDERLNASTFKKLTYKNVYQGIDIEFVIPKDKSVGIKYNVIVHEGADYRKLKMVYKGNLKGIKKNKNHLEIFTRNDLFITEHAPYSFDVTGKEIASSFVVKKDTVSFSLSPDYDPGKTLTIDPWVSSNNGFTGNPSAYDVDYDIAGNTFIYGNLPVYMVSKYNTGGGLLWTFSGAISGNFWISNPEPYAGNFCVEKYTGKIFVGQGVNTKGTRIVRLNSAGNFDYFVSVQDTVYQEVWDMSVNCLSGKVLTMGGGHLSNTSSALISNTTMSLNYTSFQPGNPSTRQDVASHCTDDAGNVFLVYSTLANPTLNNKICRANTSLNGNLWTTPTTFSAMSEAGNKTHYAGGGSANSNGVNCLAVNNTYLFYFDGYNLAAYTTSNGAIQASITVPNSSSSPFSRGGIAVDDCNNLYLGDVDQLLVYNFTGTTFSAVAAITFTGIATGHYIFDIKLDKLNNQLYVCGTNFVSKVQAVKSLTCQLPSQPCASIPGDPNTGNTSLNYVLCGGGSSVMLTPFNYQNLSNPVYSVIPGPLSNTNGSFVVSPSVTTTYTMYVTGTNTNNAVVTLTSLSTVSITPSFSMTPAQGSFVIDCVLGGTININYSPPSHYYFTSNGLTAYSGSSIAISGLYTPGNWTVTAQNPEFGCIYTKTFTIIQTNVTLASTVTPLYQSISCLSPDITPVSASITPANVMSSWISSFAPGYTVTGQTSSFTPVVPGTYTHCAIHYSTGCYVCTTFSVFALSGFPTFSTQSPQNFTLGCNSKSVTSIIIPNGQTSPPGGALLYSFLPPGATNPPTYTPVPIASVSLAGTWTVIVRDSLTGCETRVPTPVTLNTALPQLDSLTVPLMYLTCAHNTEVLRAYSSNTNVLYNWSFPSVPGNLQSEAIIVSTNSLSPSNTLVANYTLSLTDQNNACVSKTVVPVLQNIFTPSAGISLGSSSISCTTKTVLLSNQSSSGIPANSGFPIFGPVIAYKWEAPLPQQPLQFSSVYTGSIPGIYTLTVQDLTNGCFSTATSTIVDRRKYPDINQPEAPAPFILECGSPNVTIAPNLTAQPVFTYTWVPPSYSIVTSSLNKLKLTTTVPGTYLIFVTDLSNGCTNSGTVGVLGDTLTGLVEAMPTKGFAPLQVIFNNHSYSNAGNNNITTFWGFGNGGSQITYSSLVSPTVTYVSPGTYTTVSFVTKGSCIDSVYNVIEVKPPPALEIPTLFTPNGDGVNDLFFLKTKSLTEINFTIYDRWGDKIVDIKSTTGNIEWNGTNTFGMEVADGVYFYILKAKAEDDRFFEHKGNITIVR